MGRLRFTLLAVVVGTAICAVAFADGYPVWPSGTNPKNGTPITGFCDAGQAVIDTSLLMLTGPPPEMGAILAQLYPTTSDVNDVSVSTKDPVSFTTIGNGMLDCSTELKLVEEVLRNTDFSANGLTHAMVHMAWNADDAQFAADFGTYWGPFGSMWSGLPQVLKGYMIIGDGDATYSDGEAPDSNRVNATGSAGFAKAALFLIGKLIPLPLIDVNSYVRMPQYFSKTGDADGDGFSNECEYAVYGPANYVANALDPEVHPTRAECGMPEFSFASIRGGGWHEEGGPIELAVVVTGDIGVVNYQWFKDGAPIPTGVDAVYRVSDPTADDSGVYHCQATDQSKAVIDTGPIPVEILAEGSLPVTGSVGMYVLLCAVIGLGTTKNSRRRWKVRRAAGRFLFKLFAVALGTGICTVACADGSSVWPSGVNPWTGMPINGFCDALQAIQDSALGLLLPPPPETEALLAQLWPATSDANETCVAIKAPMSFTTSGNGMLDCPTELKLVEEVLRDSSFDVSGLTHSMVHAAWNANDAQFAVDVGQYWGLLPSLCSGLPLLIKGHMIIGDGDATFSDGVAPDFNRADATGSAGFVKVILFWMGSAVSNPMIDVNDYVRMPQYFSKTGDADGDGYSNECEYAEYGTSNYVANALNPEVHPTRAECGMPDITFASIRGGGWHEEGAPLELAVVVDGGIGRVDYQWFKDGAPIATGVEAVYHVADPTADDSGVYHCQVTDQSKAVIDTGPIPVEIVAEGSLPVAGFVGTCTVLCAMIGLGAAGISRRQSAIFARIRRHRS